MRMKSERLPLLLLHAMAMVMTADQEGRETERTSAAATYKAIMGRSLPDGVFDEVLDRVDADPDSAWLWLAREGVDLDEAGKEKLVSGAVRVCIADAELQDEELAALTRLARTIDVPGAELRRIMRDVWQSVSRR